MQERTVALMYASSQASAGISQSAVYRAAYPAAPDNFIDKQGIPLDSRNYVLLKGNPENGMVLLHPTLQMVGKDMNSIFNKGLIDEILKAQTGAYMHFNNNKAEHIYVEGLAVHEADNFNKKCFPQHNKHIYRELQEIAEKIETGRSLDQRQTQVFLNIGGAATYAILSKDTYAPADLYAGLDAQAIEAIKKNITGIPGLPEVSDAHKREMYALEELHMASHILRTTQLRAGRPAYVVCCPGHVFDSVFNEPNAPAVYMLKENSGC